MPEMPEVQGLVDYLDTRTRGLRISRVQSRRSLRSRPSTHPCRPSRARRSRGDPAREVPRPHRGRSAPRLPPRQGRLVALVRRAPRYRAEAGTHPHRASGRPLRRSGFDLTEAGTKKSLAVSVVRTPEDVPGIARLGPDPLDPAFDRATLASLLAGRRTQIKGVLRDQSIIAGVGNAYSDEILHAARMSPYALAAGLDAADVDRLFTAMTETLVDAVTTASGKPPAELKDAKRRGMRVHGRRGEACPVCGDEVRSVFFADNSLEYCPTCQTGGKLLADRRLSRLLK